MTSDSEDDLYRRTNKEHQAILKRHEEVENNFQLVSEVSELPNLSDEEILSRTTASMKRSKKGNHHNNKSNKTKKVKSISGERGVEDHSEDEIQTLYSCRKNRSDLSLTDETEVIEVTEDEVIMIDRQPVKSGRNLRSRKLQGAKIHRGRRESSRGINRPHKSMARFAATIASAEQVLNHRSIIDLDDSVNSVNGEEELMVKVRWKYDILRIKMLKTDCFVNIFTELAEKASVAVSRILMTLKDTVVNATDTPESIGLKPVLDILVAGVIDEPISSQTTEIITSHPDEIELKVQCGQRRKEVIVKMLKYEKMSILINKYLGVTGKQKSKVKFKFDGELIDEHMTANDLELDGGECIDAYDV